MFDVMRNNLGNNQHKVLGWFQPAPDVSNQEIADALRAGNFALSSPGSNETQVFQSPEGKRSETDLGEWSRAIKMTGELFEGARDAQPEGESDEEGPETAEGGDN